MKKQWWAYGLIILGVVSYLFGNGNNDNSSASQIIGVILFVGGLILYYLPTDNKINRFEGKNGKEYDDIMNAMDEVIQRTKQKK